MKKLTTKAFTNILTSLDKGIEKKHTVSNSIQEIAYMQKRQDKAVFLLKNIFISILSNNPLIINSPAKQVNIEDTEKNFNDEYSQAVLLEWGEKFDLNDREKEFLSKRKKTSIFFSRFTKGIFLKSFPGSIIQCDYRFICFHVTKDQIIFPHNREFTPIAIENFITTPTIIYQNIAIALLAPNTSYVVLHKGIDY